MSNKTRKKAKSQMMKQKIYIVLSMVCVVLALGIFGGVSGGEPISNLIWCVPLGILAWAFAVVSEMTDF